MRPVLPQVRSVRLHVRSVLQLRKELLLQLQRELLLQLRNELLRSPRPEGDATEESPEVQRSCR